MIAHIVEANYRTGSRHVHFGQARVRGSYPDVAPAVAVQRIDRPRRNSGNLFDGFAAQPEQAPRPAQAKPYAAAAGSQGADRVRASSFRQPCAEVDDAPLSSGPFREAAYFSVFRLDPDVSRLIPQQPPAFQIPQEPEIRVPVRRRKPEQAVWRRNPPGACTVLQRRLARGCLSGGDTRRQAREEAHKPPGLQAVEGSPRVPNGGRADLAG